MRAVVQRVRSAKVEVDGEVTGEIARGLLVYLGIGQNDGTPEASYVLEKIVNLRIFNDDEGKMDKSVLDVGGALLVVSQFTLYGDVRRGRRPSFTEAMAPGDAERAYEAFVGEAKKRISVATGRFGADMQVSSLNDGPVTIWIDSAKSG
ncbi:MAG: D-aminoacyl-tRNA deacylase [Polyangiaceae bacterium]